MDGFKELGKYVKNIDDKAERTLKKYLPPEPSMERIRDLFDFEAPFKAEIKTPSNASSISLNLDFRPRLPSLECCADCLCGATESFAIDGLSNGMITLTNHYVPESINVYVDGQRLTSLEFIEISPESGIVQILVSGTGATVSYVYTTEGCNEATCPDSFPCPDLVAFLGLALVFADRFDRASGGIPLGGCGRYNAGSFFNGVTTEARDAYISTAGGFATDALSIRPGGPNQMVGSSWEMVMRVNMTGWTTSRTFAISSSTLVFGSSASIVGFDAHFSLPYYGMDAFGPGTGTFTAIKPLSFTAGINFIRVVQIPGSFLGIRIWSEDDEEPTTWVTLSIGDFNVPGVTNVEVLWPHMNTVGVGAGVSLIKIWAGLDEGVAGINQAGSWFVDACWPNPDGLLRLGIFGLDHCDETDPLGPDTTLQGNQSPEYRVGVSTPFGVEGPPAVNAVHQWIQRLSNKGLTTSVEADDASSDFANIVVKGEVKASYTTGIGPHPVTFYSYQSQFGAPPSASQTGFNGVPAGTIFVADNVWTPFEFTLNTSGTFLLWGMAYGGDLHGGLAAGQTVAGPFPNILQINVRGVVFKPEARAHCRAGDVCGDCQHFRCAEVIDNFDSQPVSGAGSTGIRLTDTGTQVKLTPGTGASFTFSPGVGRIDWAVTGGKTTATWEYASALDCMDDDNHEPIVVEFDFRVSAIEEGQNMLLTFGGPGSRINLQYDSDFTGTNYFVSNTGFTSFGTVLFPYVAEQWVSVKYYTDQETVKIKLWVSGMEEPAAWTRELTANSTVSPFRITNLYGGNTAWVEFKDLTINGVTENIAVIQPAGG